MPAVGVSREKRAEFQNALNAERELGAHQPEWGWDLGVASGIHYTKERNTARHKNRQEPLFIFVVRYREIVII